VFVFFADTFYINRMNTSSVKLPGDPVAVPAPVADPARLPGALTLTNASRIAVAEDKPIMMDYWAVSMAKTALIGVRENGEKLLVKDADQYTSPIAKVYKVGDDFILVSENSIYIVDAKIPTKKIAS
jgi:hypothetical protein